MSEHLSLSPASPCARQRLLPAALLTGLGLALVVPSGPVRAEVLYTLDTRCALRDAAPVPCRVEAINEAGTTLYRHTIAGLTHTLRISDQPARFTLQEPGTPSWNPLRDAAVRFSTNTLCLNGTDLCVVNPNYLNSLLQERQDFRGRDLVRVRFAANGRVDLLCYDGGCDLIKARREGT
jgi:hypothetical protein